MKKSLLGLAILGAFTGVAQAQSSVTVYGSLDSGLRNQTNVNAAGDSNLTMGTGNYYSNRLGFKGVEDLGGGLKAQFALESGLSVKTGALDNTNNVLFNRTASVGLSGDWGAINLGRQYTVAFRTAGLYDPFNYKYTGIVPLTSGGGTSLPAAASAAGLSASASSGTRFNNDIQYTGTFGPVTVRAEYALGEVAGSTSNGAAQAIGASYAGGPVVVGGAYTQKKTAAGFDNKAYTIGGAYTLNNLRFSLGYAQETQDVAAGDFENKLVWGGVSYNFTPAFALAGAVYQSKLTTNVNTDGKRNLYMVGATYALSKRTNLYADIDVNRYRGVLVPSSGQTNQTGLSVGVNHMF